MTRIVLLSVLLALTTLLLPAWADKAVSGEHGRSTLLLPDGWSYALDPGGVAPRAQWAKDFPAVGALSLPHRWDDQANTQDYDGAIWYAHVVQLPATTGVAGVDLVLKNPIGLLDLYWDGTLLGHFLGNGLTRRLHVPGEASSDHRLAMRLSRTELPASLAKTVSCGIGPVAMETLPAVRIAAMTVTPSAVNADITIHYQLAGAGPCKATLNVALLSLDSRHPLERARPLTVDIPADGVASGDLTLSGRKVHRWTPAGKQTTRYRLQAELVGATGSSDLYQTEFGVTAADWSGDGHFTMAGQAVVLRGIRLPGGLPVDLAPSTATTALDAQFDILLQAGYNAIMADGAALSDDVLTLADRKGIMVIEEIPPTLDPRQPDLVSAVMQQGQHPCIVAWRWEGGTPTDSDLQAFRRLDPIRCLQLSAQLDVPTLPRGQRIVDLDLAGQDAATQLLRLRQLASGKLPALLSGTPPASVAAPGLLARRDEEQRQVTIRHAVECVRCAQRPLGYFIRPASGGSYTGLQTSSGVLDQAYNAALAYNRPELLALTMVGADAALKPELLLVNDEQSSGDYSLSFLLTTPDGLTQLHQTRSDTPVKVTGERLQDLSSVLAFAFPPCTTPGDYHLQYVLADGAKVMALSQDLPFTVPNATRQASR
jgi:hypothetical protein